MAHNLISRSQPFKKLSFLTKPDADEQKKPVAWAGSVARGEPTVDPGAYDSHAAPSWSRSDAIPDADGQAGSGTPDTAERRSLWHRRGCDGGRIPAGTGTRGRTYFAGSPGNGRCSPPRVRETSPELYGKTRGPRLSSIPEGQVLFEPCTAAGVVDSTKRLH